MRRSYAAFFAVLALLATAAVCSADGSDTAASPTYQITGYVNEEFSSGNVGLSGVRVTAYTYDTASETATAIGAGTTDSGGLFTVNLKSNNPSETAMYINFSKAEYDLRSITEYVDEKDSISVGGMTAYRLVIPSDKWEAVSTLMYGCHISSEAADGLKCFTMATTTGTLAVQVNYGGAGVWNAKVEIKNDEDSAIYKWTDSNGACTIDGIVIGTYSVTVSADGFDTVTESVIVAKGTVNKVFEMSESAHTSYLGMDLSHFLMFIGIVLGLSLAAFAMVLRRRVGKTKIDEDELRE